MVKLVQSLYLLVFYMVAIILLQALFDPLCTHWFVLIAQFNSLTWQLDPAPISSPRPVYLLSHSVYLNSNFIKKSLKFSSVLRWSYPFSKVLGSVLFNLITIDPISILPFPYKLLEWEWPVFKPLTTSLSISNLVVIYSAETALVSHIITFSLLSFYVRPECIIYCHWLSRSHHSSSWSKSSLDVTVSTLTWILTHLVTVFPQ